MDKWKRSGQNDPDRFPNFSSRNGETSYKSSQRALLLFVTARLGTPYDDTFFLGMASKKIWNGSYEARITGLGESSRGARKIQDVPGLVGSGRGKVWISQKWWTGI